eukprot:356529-Chlamydomonas_euryale.AAC.4
MGNLRPVNDTAAVHICSASPVACSLGIASGGGQSQSELQGADPQGACCVEDVHGLGHPSRRVHLSCRVEGAIRPSAHGGNPVQFSMVGAVVQKRLCVFPGLTTSQSVHLAATGCTVSAQQYCTSAAPEPLAGQACSTSTGRQGSVLTQPSLQLYQSRPL